MELFQIRLNMVLPFNGVECRGYFASLACQLKNYALFMVCGLTKLKMDIFKKPFFFVSSPFFLLSSSFSSVLCITVPWLAASSLPATTTTIVTSVVLLCVDTMVANVDPKCAAQPHNALSLFLTNLAETRTKVT